ncbi:Uncharacterised protein [Kingella negevensis]|uniref:ABM domain-containing protein n=2 Tax=Kingella negevensis TaxID=1522312 RepID=A0A238TD94_9NEIS|nr:Uncharacterised protein [Kingella negevensis]
MIGVYATCQAKADKVAEFEQLAQKFVNESRTHSGCENGYVFLEKWASKVDLDAHLACAFFLHRQRACAGVVYGKWFGYSNG